MPTVLLINGFRFFFYSNESNEPVHIHVIKADAAGKIWLEPAVSVAWFYGFTAKEEKEILLITEEQSKYFKNKWNEYFSK